MRRPTPPTCKTRNWHACNEALKRRGSLPIWFDPAMTRAAAPTGRRGRQPDDSDAAIQLVGRQHLCLHLGPIAGGRDNKAVGAQELGNQRQDLAVIVDDKDVSFGRLNCGRLLQHLSSISFLRCGLWRSQATTLLHHWIEVLQRRFGASELSRSPSCPQPLALHPELLTAKLCLLAIY